MPLEHLRYVAIEGAIGVGKTSLAKQLAQSMGADVLLEGPEKNPFLEKFYQDRGRYAMSTQLTFLLQRADQLRALQQRDLFAAPVVADFMFDKDSLFARLNLSDEEFALYSRLYQYLSMQMPVPDLVIYLQAQVGHLMQRIGKRGIAYEQTMKPDYLDRLHHEYTRFFHRYEAAPVLVVNTDELNYLEDAAHYEHLLRHIEAARSGTTFLNFKAF